MAKALEEPVVAGVRISHPERVVPRRLERLRADPWQDYWSARQRITVAMTKAVR